MGDANATRLKVEDIDWRRVEDDVIAVDLRSVTYFSLNATAADLFSWLAEGTTTPEQLVAKLLDTYETTEEQAETDVDAFLAALRERDLLDDNDAAV